MKKLSVTTVLLLALILGSTVAYAGLNWDGDPTFWVEETKVAVTVLPVSLGEAAVSVVLRVPKGVDATEPTDCPPAWECKVVHRGRADDDDEIPVKVTVKVPKAKPKLDVRVTVDVPDYGISESRDGRTGRNIKVKVEIPIDDDDDDD